MEGEFYEALETDSAFSVLEEILEVMLLRHELKEELRPLVEQRLLSEEPDDIVRNNWDILLQKFGELIQRKRNRILERLNEIQQKLGDIKLEDIEKSLEKIRRKQGGLIEELRRAEEDLENILGNWKELVRVGMMRLKQMKLELELKRLEENTQGRPTSEVKKLRRKRRNLRKKLRRLEEDLKDIERKIGFRSDVAFRSIKDCNELNIGGIEDLLRFLIGEENYRLVEPYLKKRNHLIKEMTKLREEEKELESKRKNLFKNLSKKEDLLRELKKIKLIEGNEDKIREFIKDLIREMRKEKERKEKEISYKPNYDKPKKPKLYDQIDLIRLEEDILS